MMPHMAQQNQGSTYLRTMRQDRGLTLKELSDLAGISMSYLSELERNVGGKRPSPDVLHRLANALNLADKERDEFFDSFGISGGGLRAMMFIDGRWLTTVGNRALSQTLNETTFFQFDFDGLLNAVQDKLGGGFDITRKFYFSSVMTRLHPLDEAAVEEKLYLSELLHARLRDRHHFDVILGEVDYKRRLRLRKEDRQKGEREPTNPVPISLTTELLFNAALPGAFDIAIFLVGDPHYRRVMEATRRLGKRVALVSIREACDESLYKPGDFKSIDWDVTWLDDEDVINQIELKPERKKVACSSALHTGPREVWTTELFPTDGDYYCEPCRTKQTSYDFAVGQNPLDALPLPDSEAKNVTGLVARVGHKGFGFIAVRDDQNKEGQRFYFHSTDLPAAIPFHSLRPGDRVEFEPVILSGGEEDPDKLERRAKNIRRQ